MRDAGEFATKSLPEIKFQKMVEQTNDVLSFFYVFQKTGTLHGIQGQQLARILPTLLNEKANKIYSHLDIHTCQSYDFVKIEILRGSHLSSKAYLQKFLTMKHYGDDSYSQFLHKLKDVQNYYLKSKQITEFQSLCDNMLLEQFRSVLLGEVGVFVDQHNVSSAMEMPKLADLFYKLNKDGNTQIDARRKINSRGNQLFKPKNVQMRNVNSEPSKHGINAVSVDRKTEWAQKPVAPQSRCFHCKMPNHKRSECPSLLSRSNSCARVGLENQRITGDQCVIPLYVNGKLVDVYRDSGADISLASRKIVGTGDYLIR